MVGIVGASGSGKSTLMNILGGLDRPSAGRVWVGGSDLLKLSASGLNRYRRSRVGFVWQLGSRNLIPYLTTRENVELPLTLAGQVGRSTRQRAEALLTAVELGERQNHRLGQLSGGEQQRVAIAVSLANQPTLLLADEPTGEMDTSTAQVIYQIFRKINRDMGLTILIVSHDPSLARYVDRVVAVRDGKLATETVRQAVPSHVSGDESTEEKFEELVVLDSAGRLQVPKEYLDHFHIQQRARLEMTGEGILIRPVVQTASTNTQKTDMEPDPQHPHGLRGLMARWRGGGKLK
jgi:ABC-type lipoprotein export system ATPase subunit